MLAATENVAVPLEVYDTLMEEHTTLDEFIAVLSDSVSLSWDKSRLVMDQESSRDLLTLFRIKYDDWINGVPSVQPERTCVNCGRTANNGGWYADGGTRCPIEEHYALPKDGYCHLWEKRNFTDDDYPERREDERPES